MHGQDDRDGTTRLDVAARDRGIEPPEPGDGPRVSRVPETHVHDTFAVSGIETKRREALLEAVLLDHDDVSAASATKRNGTVGIHHDPATDRAALRATLESYGLLVDPGDEAFERRRAAQFDSARIAVAVLFGLMVATPYIGVLYPTRVEWLFYDPVTVAYLQSLLDSRVATHFYVNLAALSGIAFLVACGPVIRRAWASALDRQFTTESAFVVGVLAVYTYSTLAAFTAFGGNVHYDLVAYAVIGATLWTQVVADPAADAADDGVEDRVTDDEPIALTDGGR
ncbi:hypothetical protein [Halorubrum vacuolatum]|uniref:HMA domain-containing protein n=1 Tax=Halorubrum vacuolatum TaxID=63740 RepID=A0A238V9D1_HALVU|nr:hypothetical protein [Halorubrum vacuolatum]SNR31005.1 hypothetical protein SAMN06264855_102130 [Halorubrum vacuolatum]